MDFDKMVNIMKFDKILNKYDDKFKYYRDYLHNIKKDKFKILIDNNQLMCECNTTYNVGSVLTHLEKDDKGRFIDNMHNNYKKNKIKYLERKVYKNYIKRNLIIDKYFLINKYRDGKIKRFSTAITRFIK